MTEQLKALAMAAAVIDHNENRGWYSWDYIINNGADYPKNARFIAAASPDVILALIAEHEEQSRLLGMSGSREADLIARRDADEALMREVYSEIMDRDISHALDAATEKLRTRLGDA